MELRELFGRNIHITKEARKVYDRLELGFVFDKMRAKSIFMICLALAYIKKLPRKEIKRYPLLNTESFSDEDLWTIASIAIESSGNIDIIGNPNEMKKIAEEYSIAGLEELQQLLQEYRTTDNFLLMLEKKIKEGMTKLQGHVKKSGLDALREDKTVEFKSSIQWDYKEKKQNRELMFDIAKAISAFMNTGGGRLIIGIDDEKNVMGIEKDISLLKKQNEDGFQLKINDIVCNFIGKEHAHLVEIKFQDKDNKKIASVMVEKSDEPTYVEYKGNTYFYIRTGNSSQLLNQKESHAYIKKRWP